MSSSPSRPKSPTSASFEIGVTSEEGNGLDPIELSRSSMNDNVGADLHGQPQHA